MINDSNLAAEQDRQLRIVDAVAGRIAASMRREFRRVAKNAHTGYLRSGRRGAQEAIIDHQQKVQEILTRNIDALISKYATDIVKELPQRKSVAVRYIKNLGEEFEREEEDEVSEELALLLLLIGNATNTWQVERIGPASNTIANTSASQLERAITIADQEANALTLQAADPDMPTLTPERIQTQSAATLRNTFLQSSLSRGDLIGNTESHTASQASTMLVAQDLETGIQVRTPNLKQWISRRDDKVRGFPEDEFSHRMADSQRQPLDQPFQIPKQGGGTEALMYPGDTNGSPGNVINCRCVMNLIISDGE